MTSYWVNEYSPSISKAQFDDSSISLYEADYCYSNIQWKVSNILLNVAVVEQYSDC